MNEPSSANGLRLASIVSSKLTIKAPERCQMTLLVSLILPWNSKQQLFVVLETIR